MSNHSKEKRCNTSRDEYKIEVLTSFRVAEKDYYLPKGYYLVADLKRVAGIPECHILAEIRDGEVDAMKDDTATHISGCEEFKSFPGKGDAS